MKREAFSHPKMQLVARDLQIDHCYARGIIESLWLVAQNNFPQGDIGRWTDDEIAIAMGYTGDAGELIDILRKRKLLDALPVEDGRLYIHDWHVHSEDWIHMRLARHALKFANGADPRLARLPRKDREKLTHSERTVSAHERTVSAHERTTAHYPSPSPVTEHNSSQNSVDIVATEVSSPAPQLKTVEDAAAAAAARTTALRVSRREPPVGGSSSSSSAPVKAKGEEEGDASPPVNCAGLAKELSRTHPRSGSLRRARKAIEAERLTVDQAAQMRRSHGEYVAYYARAQPGFIPDLARWVEDGDWLRLPPDAEPSAPRKQPVSEIMLLAMELEEEQREKARRRAAANGRAS